MRRNEFLTELRNGLVGRVSPAELEDILNDYRELFEEGLREGKTEEAICAEMGSPAETVQLILAERPSSGHAASSGHAPFSGHVASTGQAAVDQGEVQLYAPLYKRIAAALLDFLLSVLPLAFIGNVANVIPIMIVWPPAPLFYAVNPSPTTGMITAAYFCMCYYAFYHSLFLLLFKGQTPGKRWMRLRVVSQDGKRLGAMQIIGRELLGRLFINSITFGIGYLVSMIWSLLTREHKTIHDVIAGTRVIQEHRFAGKEVDSWIRN